MDFELNNKYNAGYFVNLNARATISVDHVEVIFQEEEPYAVVVYNHVLAMRMKQRRLPDGDLLLVPKECCIVNPNSIWDCKSVLLIEMIHGNEYGIQPAVYFSRKTATELEGEERTEIENEWIENDPELKYAVEQYTENPFEDPLLFEIRNCPVYGEDPIPLGSAMIIKGRSGGEEKTVFDCLSETDPHSVAVAVNEQFGLDAEPIESWLKSHDKADYHVN